MKQLELPIRHGRDMAVAFRRATHSLREFNDYTVSQDEFDGDNLLPSWQRLGGGADAVVFQHRREPVVVKLPIRSVMSPEETLGSAYERQQTARYSILPPVLLAKVRSTRKYVPDSRLRFARIHTKDDSLEGNALTTPVVLQELVSITESDEAFARPDLFGVQQGGVTPRYYADKSVWHAKTYPQVAKFRKAVRRIGMSLYDTHGNNWTVNNRRLLVLDTGRFLQGASADKQTRAELEARRVLGSGYRALLRWAKGSSGDVYHSVLPEARPVRRGKRGGWYVQHSDGKRRYIRSLA